MRKFPDIKRGDGDICIDLILNVNTPSLVRVTLLSRTRSAKREPARVLNFLVIHGVRPRVIES